MATVVGATLFFYPSEAQLRQQVDEEYPKTAVEFMQRQHFTGRVFNQYKWGGYMAWYAPELKHFIDGRVDIFLFNGAFDDFLRATVLKHSFEILDKYNIDYVLLEPNQPLVYLLEHSPAWHPIYVDKLAVLFERGPVSSRTLAPAKAGPN